MSRFLNGIALSCLVAGGAVAQDLGRPATPEEVTAWDIDVRPDGTGLPDGSGDVSAGETVYSENCAVCHGVFGEGEGRWPVLMGGFGTLDSQRPVKTIGSYWPYLSTVWDYVHRAMPFGAAQSLTNDEVYAVTAYLLYLNDLVDDDFVLTRENLAEIRLPNEGDFYLDDRAEVELPKFTHDVCMSDCKDDVEITMHAAVLDVTPGGGGASLEDGGSAPEAGDSGVADTAEAMSEGDSAPETVPQDGEAQVAEPDGAAPAEGGDTDLTLTEADPALVAEGEKLFRQCKACHQVGEGAKNRTGPHLNGVVGRAAGSVDDFRYSSAMAEAGDAGLVWDAVSLEAFLTDPRGYMKGTKMSFRGLKEEDVPAVLAYLGSLGE